MLHQLSGWLRPDARSTFRIEMYQSIMFQPPGLTRHRVRLAYAVAVAADLLQLLLGPLGWVFADEIVDVAAMILTWRLIGFHPLLLPTFALEFLPVADLLPTWTGCVALVVAHRTKSNRPPRASRPPERPVHTLAIAVLGVPLVDNGYFEDVAREAARTKPRLTNRRRRT